MNIGTRVTISTAAIAASIALLAGCSGGADTPPAPAASHSATKSTPTKTPAAQGTVAQLQALAAAKSYLAMGSGFSQAGLLQQLTSTAGNGFNQADAQWAIDHSGADWNAQAVMAAKTYMQMGGFSHDSLMEQLTSPAGNQFTQDQAAYAVVQVGL